MNICLIEHLDRKGSALAEALCALGHSVFVLHPDRWDYDGPYREALGNAQTLSATELNGYDALICLQNPQDPSCVGPLAERILAAGNRIPMILLEERPMDPATWPRCSAAASQFRTYVQEAGLKGYALTVPAMFGADFLPDMLEQAVQSCVSANTVTFQGEKKDVCDMMHVEDVSSLLLSLLENRTPEPPELMIRSGHEFLYEWAAEMMRQLYPHCELAWAEPPCPTGFRGCVSQAPGDWQPRHSVEGELPAVLRNIDAACRRQIASRTRTRMSGFFRAAAFLLSFAAVWAYSFFTHAHPQLQFVDLRLLFVVAVSVMLPRRWGIAAALLAGLSGTIDRLLTGTAWHVLVYRPSNWIPFAVYLACAILFGMLRESRLSGTDAVNT